MPNFMVVFEPGNYLHQLIIRRRHMPLDYLHRHEEYKDLIRTVAEEKGIALDLVEKDYTAGAV